MAKAQKTIRAARPNAGVEALYRRRLTALITQMDNSVRYWLAATYRAGPPVMAQDRTPADLLGDALKKLARRWTKQFDTLAKSLATWFAKAATDRSDASLRAALRKGGMSVKFKLTPAAKDILQATIQENVSLIKSIPQQFFTQIEGAVMRSVTAGRDVGGLTKELQKQFGITKRRAHFIALDQNNKATAAIQRARLTELGIKEAVWIHSHGGKHPRPTHIKNDGNRYEVSKGWFDPAIKKYIWPGTEPGCRCVGGAVIPGLS